MRLRYSIRECLFVTSLVALALGWWVDHQQLAKDLSKANVELAAATDNGIHCQQSVDWWKDLALGLARLMREDGWHVHIDEKWTLWGYAHRKNLSRKQANEMNNAEPLPSRS